MIRVKFRFPNYKNGKSITLKGFKLGVSKRYYNHNRRTHFLTYQGKTQSLKNGQKKQA